MTDYLCGMSALTVIAMEVSAELVVSELSHSDFLPQHSSIWAVCKLWSLSGEEGYTHQSGFDDGLARLMVL
jgi:hypothetical protein